MKIKKSNLVTDNTGIVSIVVTMVLLLVISLMVVAFSYLARQEQRDEFDYQLSSEAYYAAESGLNDATRWLKNDPGTTEYNTNCTDALAVVTNNAKFDDLTNGGSAQNLSTSLGDVTTGSEYTCLMIKRRLDALQYSSVDMDSGKYAIITAYDSAGNPKNIDSLLISWKDESGLTAFRDPGDKTFTSTAAWKDGAGNNQTGVLHVDVTRLNGFTRNNLIANTGSAFLYPNRGAAGSVGNINMGPISTTKKGEIVSSECNIAHNDPVNLPLYCNVRIRNVNSTRVLVRLRSFYHASTVSIKAFSGGGNGTILSLEGGQATVDVTGKASDVLRRIRANVDLTSSAHFPSDALNTSDSICKLLNAQPSITTTPCPGVF